MGVNGAFLTGDIFNRFVFFEVLLAASYGLVLHGSGVVRIKAVLHYVTINVATSLLFLIGVSLIYAVTGTLNMADLAARIPLMATSDLALLEGRSEEHTSELQSLMRISYAVFCLKKKKTKVDNKHQ